MGVIVNFEGKNNIDPDFFYFNGEERKSYKNIYSLVGIPEQGLFLLKQGIILEKRSMFSAKNEVKAG